MNRYAALLLLAVAPAAFAADPAAPAPAPAAEAPVAEAGTPAAEAEADVAAAADAKRPARRNCIRETGTMLPHRDADGCTGLAGESYDREDIARTGATDVADALRLLSPSVTIRR